MKRFTAYLRFYGENGTTLDGYGNKFDELPWGEYEVKDEDEAYREALMQAERAVKENQIRDNYDIELIEEGEIEEEVEEEDEERCPKCSHGCNWCLMLEV